jgi:hypothetical protein
MGMAERTAVVAERHRAVGEALQELVFAVIDVTASACAMGMGDLYTALADIEFRLALERRDEGGWALCRCKPDDETEVQFLTADGRWSCEPSIYAHPIAAAEAWLARDVDGRPAGDEVTA